MNLCLLAFCLFRHFILMSYLLKKVLLINHYSFMAIGILHTDQHNAFPTTVTYSKRDKEEALYV